MSITFLHNCNNGIICSPRLPPTLSRHGCAGMLISPKGGKRPSGRDHAQTFRAAGRTGARRLQPTGPDQATHGKIDEQRLLAAESDPDNWLSYGRTYDEQRFSPLTDINDGNVGQLGLACAVQLDTTRGQEATPIVVDGVMYISTAWSKVMAIKADTGEAAVEVRSENNGAQGRACLLRRGQPRGRGVGGQGLRRHDRRAADRARRRHRQASLVRTAHRRPEEALHDHQGAARGARQGDHRQQRRRAGRARLCHRL